MTTYRRIKGVIPKMMVILGFLADQKEPVSGAEIAKAVDMSIGTTMCHLATLEDERVVRRIGKYWEMGDRMAIFWARRKAQLEGGIDRMKNQLRELGVENNG